MGHTYPEGTGFRVEAMRPGEAIADSGPMLFSAEASDFAEALRDRFGRRLKEDALAIAKRDGRKTVTADDIWTALAGMDLKELASEEEPDDGD